jgi:predicted nuclease of predicted toxin-antitoxin system
VRRLLDHHYPPLIAQRLRERGFDVVAANEVGLEMAPDEAVFDYAVTHERALLTNDVAGFMRIHRDSLLQGRAHFGVIFTSDSTWSRAKSGIGPLVDRFAEILRDRPAAQTLADQLLWP